MPGGGDNGPKLDLGGLLAAASGVVAAIRGLAATGTLGRLQRNQPEAFIAALALVLFGAAIWTVASLPGVPWPNKTNKQWRRPWLWQAPGIHFTVGGVGLALGVAIFTVNDQQRPRVAGEVDQRTNELKATVRAANLASDEKLVVWVDGLIPSEKEKGRVFDFTTLAHSYIGPSPNGEVDLPNVRASKRVASRPSE